MKKLLTVALVATAALIGGCEDNTNNQPLTPDQVAVPDDGGKPKAADEVCPHRQGEACQ